MNKQLAVLSFLVFFFAILQAQTSYVYTEGKKISFIITSKTTKSEILKADSVFRSLNVAAVMNASWKGGEIYKLSISVTCDKGSADFNTDRAGILKKGVTILVDRTPDATVPFCIGTCGQTEK